MARSSKMQAKANRDRIVEVASGLFRAHGADTVGIAQIMEAVGMTQGGFYRHFDSKEALLAEACAFAFDKATENWTRVASDAVAGGRDAAIAIEEHYLTPKSPEKTCPIIAHHTDARHPVIAEVYAEGTRRLLAIYFEAGRDRDAFAAMIGKAMIARADV